MTESRPQPVGSSLSDAERRFLEQLDELDDVLDLLDFRVDYPAPLDGEWPYDHPPGDARPIDGAIEPLLEENERSWSREQLDQGGR